MYYCHYIIILMVPILNTSLVNIFYLITACIYPVIMKSSTYRQQTNIHTYIYVIMYITDVIMCSTGIFSIFQKIWACFWHVSFYCDYIIFWWLMSLIHPYSSGLLHWHWGNHMIAPVPVKQPWRIWVNQSVPNHNKTWTMCILYGNYCMCLVISGVQLSLYIHTWISNYTHIKW